jgi:hypothetical protein
LSKDYNPNPSRNTRERPRATKNGTPRTKSCSPQNLSVSPEHTDTGTSRTKLEVCLHSVHTFALLVPVQQTESILEKTYYSLRRGKKHSDTITRKIEFMLKVSHPQNDSITCDHVDPVCRTLRPSFPALSCGCGLLCMAYISASKHSWTQEGFLHIRPIFLDFA